MNKIILLSIVFIAVALFSMEKDISIDKSNYSDHYPGVWMNISTGEIQPIGVNSEPPKGYELYVDPESPAIFEFANYNEESKILYLGDGQNIYDNWSEYLDQGLLLKRILGEKNLINSILYISSPKNKCIIFIKSLDKELNSVQFLCKKAIPQKTVKPKPKNEPILESVNTDFKQYSSLIVKKIKILKNDNAAKIRKVNDSSGNACALIKVKTKIKKLEFVSDKIINSQNYRNGEFKIYVAESINKIIIKSGAEKIEYKFKEKLQSGITYRMSILKNPNAQKVMKVSKQVTSNNQESNSNKKQQIKKTKVSSDYVYKPVIRIPDIDMIDIKGGKFLMGSNEGFPSNQPEHYVKVNNFCIGKYEVSQKLWKAIVPSEPFRVTGNNYPVDAVNWYEAVEFCNILSEKMNYEKCYTINKNTSNENVWNVICNFKANGFRLPTEAEWEYASKYNNYTTKGEDLKSIAWYRDNSQFISHPVGDKSPTSLGIYDLFGNVAEWCWDWYLDDYYSLNVEDNPTGPVFSERKVLRGGSINNREDYISAYIREHNVPYINQTPYGLRLVRTK